MEYYIKSSNDYELLERLLHKIAYINHHTHSCPCTYQINGKRHEGIIYEDDWRVFIDASAKNGVSHYEVTRRRNKYTGIVEGMMAMNLRFSIPIEYSKQYEVVRQEIQQIREKRKPFIKYLKDKYNKIPKIWLIDEFIRLHKTPDDLLKLWAQIQKVHEEYPDIPYGAILTRYRNHNWDPTFYPTNI